MIPRIDTTDAVLRDAINHYNLRERGRDARVARLRAAGVPCDDRAALGEWIKPRLAAEHAGRLAASCNDRLLADLYDRGEPAYYLTRYGTVEDHGASRDLWTQIEPSLEEAQTTAAVWRAEGHDVEIERVPVIRTECGFEMDFDRAEIVEG